MSMYFVYLVSVVHHGVVVYTPIVGVRYEIDSIKLGDIATTGIIYVVIGTSKGAYHTD